MDQKTLCQDQDFVSDLIQNLHTRTQDFEEGDLLHRATKFLHYEQKLLDLSQIDLCEFSIDEDKWYLALMSSSAPLSPPQHFHRFSMLPAR